MKALSIHPYWAGQIFIGKKTIEVRTWKTYYRGEILICSTNKKWKGTIPGHALCTVQLRDVVPFTKKHLQASGMKPGEMIENAYAWLLEDVRPIRPVPVKGKLGLWEYTGEIEYLKEPETDEEDEAMFHEIYESLLV